MEKKVRTFMEEYHMVERGEGILAAVSGGADSMAMLLVLLALRRELKLRLSVVHVEHGIRGVQSLRDADFVKEFCSQHQIPCRIFSCRALEYARERKLTVEEGARKLRYQFFRKAALEFDADKIAVAHNQNDCAETMIFHLVRGTGLKGLRGILPVREQIIRPLLCVTRQEIEVYLSEKKQEFCTDQTNEELLYTRNKIRHQVLPMLCELNPQAVSHLNQTASFAAEAVELLEELTEDKMETYVRKMQGGICISQELLQEKPLVQRMVLQKTLAEAAGSSQNITSIHIRQLQELLHNHSGKRLSLPYGMEAQRGYEGIWLGGWTEQGRKLSEKTDFQAGNLPEEARKQTFGLSEVLQTQAGLSRENEEAAETESGWRLPQSGSLFIPGWNYEIHTRVLEKIPQNEEIPKKIYTKWMDYDKIKGNMLLRTRQEQDFLVLDAQGRRKKLKKYFVDEKIPGYEREQTLLLAEDSHILWVIGHRISEAVKVTEHTKRILEIRVNGGTAHE